MAENEYNNIKISNDTYEQLREIKYLTKKSFIEIIGESIDEKYKEVKSENRKRE